MQEFNYYRPETKDDLLMLLDNGNDRRILAGGTDILPRLRKGFRFENNMVDITRVKDFDFISVTADEIEIGSLTTYDKIIRSAELQEAAPVLVEAASVVGSNQTRQKGTIGGNIGNASPAGDILLPLLAMEAEVVLLSAKGERRTALSRFITGPGRTDLRAGEVIAKICMKRPGKDTHFFFHKQGKRNAMACSIVNIAMAVKMAGAKVDDLRIAVGSVAPTPLRCKAAEGLVRGQVLTESLIELAGHTAMKEVSPIDDVRGSASYRKILVKQLVQRGLKRASQPETH